MYEYIYVLYDVVLAIFPSVSHLMRTVPLRMCRVLRRRKTLTLTPKLRYRSLKPGLHTRPPIMNHMAFSIWLVLIWIAPCLGLVQVPVVQSSFITTSHAQQSSVLLHASSMPGDTGLSRRQMGELSIAALGLGTTFIGTRENDPTDYGLWGILPVGTYKKKITTQETIVDGQVWTFDQKFGILNVQVPLRMTIIKLSSGGLFLYNPIAATRELLDMVQTLVQQYGPVKYIALGSVALEHKV